MLSSEVGEVDFSEAMPEDSTNTLAPIVQVATGRNHVLALDTNGRVFAWGDNMKGQLGLGRREKHKSKRDQRE